MDIPFYFDFSYIDNGMEHYFSAEIDLALDYEHYEGRNASFDHIYLPDAPQPAMVEINDWDFSKNEIVYNLNGYDESINLSEISPERKEAFKAFLENHINYDWVEEKILEELNN